MLDDELLLTAAEGVDYSSLPSMPTPEEFYLLSRVKGQTSVAQLCAASGWGKEKAKTTIEKLIGFGLLVTDEDITVESDSKSTQEAPPVESNDQPEAPPRGGPGANDPDATPEKTGARTQERPAVTAASDAAKTAVGPDETPLYEAEAARDREVTPQRSVAVDREQKPARDERPTPVRKESSAAQSSEPQSTAQPAQSSNQPAQSYGFDIPVIEEDEDDLFMADSPAHISKIRGGGEQGSSTDDASTTRPVEAEAGTTSSEPEERPSEASAASSEPEPEPQPAGASSSESTFKASRTNDDDNGAGFAILDSEVADEAAVPDELDAQTRMIDPTSLEIANSVAVDGAAVETNRGGAAVEGPLAFAMLPGEVGAFNLDPELLDPELEIDAKARQEVAYVCEHLDSVNYYQLFGLTADASRKEIKKAYFVLSKRFHPDLYFRKKTGPFGEMVERVFKAVTGAYQVLSHRKRRAEYDDELKHLALNPPAQAKNEQQVDPLAEKKELARELLIKRATTHEVKGEFVRAADSLRKAIAIRPEPALMVKLGNALYRANKRLDDAANYCRAALREDPKNLDGMLVLAKILERNEAYDEALRVLERARTVAPDEASIGVHEDRIRNLMNDA